ncbi:YihY/virulence factor BrkB family protein [Caulobacter sp. KR2-114]|uniref:YihY/virulence factor BrkB family protein n=1 Tax=Caulobacter sp. KR2-114 TaxID=3400912 RepID=UPI003BFD0C20
MFSSRLERQLQANVDGARTLAHPGHWPRLIIFAVQEFVRDDMPSVSAGVTFYSLLALFPALSAIVSLYGLFADVDGARRQVGHLAGVIPEGAVRVLDDAMLRLSLAQHGGLTVTLILSVAISLYSANAGMKALLRALSRAYEQDERRGFVKLNLVSLAFTGAGAAFAVLTMACVVGAPELLARLGLRSAALLGLLRWPVLLLLLVVSLSLLYALGPDRRSRWRLVAPGNIVGALGWTAMSVGFSWYVAHFGQFDRTFGSLGGVAGFMTWIWLSVMVVMFGAELNAAVETCEPIGR